MSEAIEKDWTDGQNGDKNGMRTLTKGIQPVVTLILVL